MKTKIFTLAALLIGGGLLVACGTEAGTETERVNEQMQENRKEISNADDAQEWMKQRDEARAEMADLRESMTNRLERERKRMADGIKDAEKRAATESHITELERNIARIDANNMALDNATMETWMKVKEDSRKAGEETRTWWEGLKDDVDAKTDADNDNDGK